MDDREPEHLPEEEARGIKARKEWEIKAEKERRRLRVKRRRKASKRHGVEKGWKP
jgi:hypothetical protein